MVVFKKRAARRLTSGIIVIESLEDASELDDLRSVEVVLADLLLPMVLFEPADDVEVVHRLVPGRGRHSSG